MLAIFYNTYFNMGNEMNIGTEIQNIREGLNLTQDDFGKLVNLYASRISLIEQGANITVKTLLQIAVGLNKKLIIKFED